MCAFIKEKLTRAYAVYVSLNCSRLTPACKGKKIKTVQSLMLTLFQKGLGFCLSVPFHNFFAQPPLSWATDILLTLHLHHTPRDLKAVTGSSEGSFPTSDRLSDGHTFPRLLSSAVALVARAPSLCSFPM